MDQQILLQALLRQDADQTNEWVQNVLGGIESAPKDFNWLGLAEGATFNAEVGNKLSSILPDLTWAKVAVAIYEYLISENDINGRMSFEISMMYLRAYCIEALGSVPNDPILDVNQIIEWFFTNCEMSLEEAEEKTLNWKERSLEEMRALRSIKNRLSVIKGLSPDSSFKRDQELNQWLALWAKLP